MNELLLERLFDFYNDWWKRRWYNIEGKGKELPINGAPTPTGSPCMGHNYKAMSNLRLSHFMD